MLTLSSEYSRRFWTAPSVARWALTLSMAASMLLIADALDSVDQPEGRTAVEPSEIMLTLMTSLSFEPTWKVTAVVLSSSEMPLNLVVVPMRLISLASWLTSDWTAVWSVELSVPFLYWTASSRTRWSMLWTVLRAPSAVWTSETPSPMLRWFWARPRIWPRIFSEMARPAASSAARLIR